MDYEGETLPAIVSRPNGVPEENLGVLIVAGGQQYRAGSHRQFVLLARVLADRGYPTMRFDRPGTGDATGGQLSLEDIAGDIAAAIAAMCANCPQIRGVVLWGLCDGASASLLYRGRTHDPRVVGLALVNPWVRTALTLARTRVKHYYPQRLGHREFWEKLLRGRIDGFRALREVFENMKLAINKARPVEEVQSWRDAMAQALRVTPGPVFLLLSGQDYTAREFTEWLDSVPGLRSFKSFPNVQIHNTTNADHTFSNQQCRSDAEQATLAWLNRVRAGL